MPTPSPMGFRHGGQPPATGAPPAGPKLPGSREGRESAGVAPAPGRPALLFPASLHWLSLGRFPLGIASQPLGRCLDHAFMIWESHAVTPLASPVLPPEMPAMVALSSVHRLAHWSCLEQRRPSASGMPTCTHTGYHVISSPVEPCGTSSEIFTILSLSVPSKMAQILAMAAVTRVSIGVAACSVPLGSGPVRSPLGDFSPFILPWSSPVVTPT